MKRILIVDDDVVIRIAFQKLLNEGEYIIQQARDLREAMEALKNNIYDVVLLDMRLSPVGAEAGFQILAKKRKTPLNAETPVIIISGQFNKDQITDRTDLEDNIAEILEKPVGNDVLIAAVDNVLGV